MCVRVRVFVRVRVCVYLCVSADKQSAAQFATPHRHVDIDRHGNHSPLWQSEMFVEVGSVFLAIFFPECIPKSSATTVVADDVGNNHFGPYKQPYSPRHPNTMHVTEKLYVPCNCQFGVSLRTARTCECALHDFVACYNGLFSSHMANHVSTAFTRQRQA